jgi:hypothetical protein
MTSGSPTMREFASVPFDEERLMLLRLLKNWVKAAGKINLSGSVIISVRRRPRLCRGMMSVRLSLKAPMAGLVAARERGRTGDGSSLRYINNPTGTKHRAGQYGLGGHFG